MNRGLWLGLLFAGALFNPLSAEAASNSAPPRVTGVVNLNNATPEQLKMLPGVKDKAAAEIVHETQRVLCRSLSDHV